MNIQTFKSSSSGNLYRISDGNTRLLIEAGISARKIKEALDFRLDEIAACLITHEHGDHIKGAAGLMKAGIDCHMTAGTAEAADLSGHRACIIEPGKQFSIGTWTIKPFRTIHHNKAGIRLDSVGFLLASGRERLIFATDTQYVPKRFRGLTHLMIECNYDLHILKQNVKSGALDLEASKGVIKNHMSLETCKEFFRVNDMRKVQEIYLLHLSSTNADAAMFRREIQRISGRPVYIGGE